MADAAIPDAYSDVRIVMFAGDTLADALRRTADYVDATKAHMFTDSAVAVVCEPTEEGWWATLETDVTVDPPEGTPKYRTS